MSELKKLLEDIAIKVRGKYEAEIHGFIRKRSYFHDFANGGDDLAALGARVILRLMDEYEEPKPASRKEAIAELARQEMADGYYVCDSVEEQQAPFTGPHWDTVERFAKLAEPGAIFTCLRDLRDEVWRLKEGK